MAFKSGNPALYLPVAGEAARLAREGMIAEFDMLTFSGGNNKLLLDQSGNGNNALFNLTPTLSSTGTTFGGTYWADFTLPVLARNYTYFAVILSNSGGFFVFGSYNASDQRGSSLRLGAVAPGLSSAQHGSTGNVANGPTSNGSAWVPIIVKMSDDNQARIKQLGTGILGYRNSLRGEDYGDEDRTLWRIGAAMQTSGADHTVNYLPLEQGTIAYCGVYNRVTTDNQDAALLHYLRGKLAGRGITF